MKQHFDSTDGRELEGDIQKYFSSNHSIIGRLPRPVLRSLLEDSSGGEFFKGLFKDSFLKKLGDYLCQGNIFRPRDSHPTSFILGVSGGAVLDRIHRELDHQNIAAIDYYANFFEKDNVEPDPDSRHVSVIVGRRWNKEKGQCELLIRNSWGNHCYGYTAESLRHACEAGNIWVAEKTLSRYTYGASYFDRENNGGRK